MNKCQIFGKFKKLDELQFCHIPDSIFGGEDNWYECLKCNKEKFKEEEK